LGVVAGGEFFVLEDAFGLNLTVISTYVVLKPIKQKAAF